VHRDQINEKRARDIITGTVTRRQFIFGLLGTGALAAGTSTLLTGCEKKDATAELIEAAATYAPNAQISYLEVREEQIVAGSDAEEAVAADYLHERASFDLPIGCLLHQDSENFAVVLQSHAGTQGSDSLVTLSFLNLQNGQLRDLLASPISASQDYVIYDARANEQLLIWVECHLASNGWRVYAAPLTEGSRGSETLLDEGDALFEPPMLCVCNESAYWTVMPDPEGAASHEDSLLKRARLQGAGNSVAVGATEQVYVSHGRMITNPQASDGVLTFVPRVDVSTVFYQLTALDDASSEIFNVAILPPALRVSDAVFGPAGFSFQIEANYDYAQGLSLYGTYQELPDERFFFANKTPSSPVAYVGDCLYLKSTKNIIGFDVRRNRSFVVETPKDCVDYGDVLAGSGARQTLVAYTTIVNKMSVDKSVTRVRVLEPVASEAATDGEGADDNAGGSGGGGSGGDGNRGASGGSGAGDEAGATGSEGATDMNGAGNAAGGEAMSGADDNAGGGDGEAGATGDTG
jgi:hypothetical protein